jgi:PPIC-type PPIASE domain
MNEPSPPNSPSTGDFFDFNRTDSRRSFLLLAIGAIVGLAIAGYGLFTAKGTSTNRLPPEDIALVNQKPIYRSDFLIQTQTLYSVPFKETTHEQRHKVLDDMINEELMVQRGIEVDLPGYDPDVRTALVNGVELQMYADVLAKAPTEAELQAYYDHHRDKYASIGVMRLRDLLVNTPPNETDALRMARAVRVVAELRAGAKLDDAFMQSNGVRDSGALFQSGKPDLDDIFDFAAQAKLTPNVYAVAKKLSAGQVSDPINDTDGIHIVVITARSTPKAPDFAAVRERVWADLKTEAQDNIRNATYGYLRNKADILAADAY